MVFFSVVLLISLFSVGTAAEEDFDAYYCRAALATQPNATALLYAYDQIVAGVEASLGEIKVYNDTDPITAEEMRIVVDAYRRDHTEHFWFGNEYKMSYNSTSILKVIPTYTMEGAALEEARRAFDAALDSMVADLSSVASEFERELILHDRLAATVTYTTTQNAHNAYGALVEGKAVCEGYAEALQCLLHRVNIQSLLVFGSSVNPSTGMEEGHAWNMVRIDGSYYHTDLTWNDQGRSLYHAYFNQTDAAITEDHKITATAYALPVCSSQAANYFTVRGGLISAYSVEQIAELLKNNQMSISIYLTGNVSDFIDWYRNNASAIAQKAGVTGAYSFNLSGIGREYHLSIEVCEHTTLQAVAAKAVTCTENGNQAYYVCSCGKLFEDAQAQKEIAFRDSVIIYSQGHKWSEKIEDEAHLKAGLTDCRGGNLYWYDCASCNAISDSAYFEDGKLGDHVYADEWSQGDDAGHWHTCLYCDAHDAPTAHTLGSPATEQTPQVCTVCGYEIAPALQKTETQTAKPNSGSGSGSGSNTTGGGEFTSLGSLSGCVMSVANVGTMGLSVLLSLLMLKKKQRH